MQTFNQNRLHIVTEHYLNYSGKVLSPKEANALEPVLTTVNRYFNHIKFGAKLSSTDQNGLSQFQIDQLESNEYCLILNMKSKSLIQNLVLKICFEFKFMKFRKESFSSVK
jgi:hypothetical protein